MINTTQGSRPPAVTTPGQQPPTVSIGELVGQISGTPDVASGPQGITQRQETSTAVISSRVGVLSGGKAEKTARYLAFQVGVAIHVVRYRPSKLAMTEELEITIKGQREMQDSFLSEWQRSVYGAPTQTKPPGPAGPSLEVDGEDCRAIEASLSPSAAVEAQKRKAKAHLEKQTMGLNLILSSSETREILEALAVAGHTRNWRHAPKWGVRVSGSNYRDVSLTAEGLRKWDTFSRLDDEDLARLDLSQIRDGIGELHRRITATGDVSMVRARES